MGKRGPADGLVGMWAFSYDDRMEVTMMFQILRKTGDAYICQMYSLDDGKISELKVIRRKDIVAGRTSIFTSHFELNDALEQHEEKREMKMAAWAYLQSRAAKQPQLQQNRETSLTLN